MTFVVADRRFETHAGELLRWPRHVPHTIANLGDEPVWAFGVTTPTGLEVGGLTAQGGEAGPSGHPATPEALPCRRAALRLMPL